MIWNSPVHSLGGCRSGALPILAMARYLKSPCAIAASPPAVRAFPPRLGLQVAVGAGHYPSSTAAIAKVGALARRPLPLRKPTSLARRIVSGTRHILANATLPVLMAH